MRVSCAVILALAAVGGTTGGEAAHRFDVYYCVTDAAADAIGIPRLRDDGDLSPESELRVWVSRGRDPGLLFRVAREHGEVVAQFAAFELSVGNERPGFRCDAIGVELGITVLDHHVVPLADRSRILHRLLATGAWRLKSSAANLALGDNLSLILERRKKGSYGIAAHDNPERSGGPDEIAACEIIRVLDGYAAGVGLDFKPDSCDVASQGSDSEISLKK